MSVWKKSWCTHTRFFLCLIVRDKRITAFPAVRTAVAGDAHAAGHTVFAIARFVQFLFRDRLAEHIRQFIFRRLSPEAESGAVCLFAHHPALFDRIGLSVFDEPPAGRTENEGDNELPQGKPQTSTGRLTAAHATRLGYLNSRFAVMTTTSSNTTVCTHLVYLVASHILESHFHS